MVSLLSRDNIFFSKNHLADLNFTFHDLEKHFTSKITTTLRFPNGFTQVFLGPKTLPFCEASWLGQLKSVGPPSTGNTDEPRKRPPSWSPVEGFFLQRTQQGKNGGSIDPRKIHHTPTTHPRQSPSPTMKGIPLWPVDKRFRGVFQRCVETTLELNPGCLPFLPPFVGSRIHEVLVQMCLVICLQMGEFFSTEP